MPGETSEPVGRAPRPPRGDPNVKAIRLSLTTEEWRKLRALAAEEARDEATTGGQAKAFESGLPSAKVVRIPHADHYVFRSNEADVLREMNAFISGLP